MRDRVDALEQSMLASPQVDCPVRHYFAPGVFAREMTNERLVRPFDLELAAGRYWLTRLHSRVESGASAAFAAWLMEEVRPSPSPDTGS